MTTSGITAFERTGDQIIDSAYRHTRKKQRGQPLEEDDIARAKVSLNGIIKSWQRDGLHLWKDEECALFLNINQRYYDVDDTIDATNGDWVATETAADALAAATSITVDSITPLGYSGQTYIVAENNHIGIENDNNVLEWFQVTTATGTTINLDGALAVQSTAGNRVWIYRTRATKPLKIYQENIRLWQSDNYELPLYLLAQTDYNLLPQKDITGTLVQIFHTPKINDARVTVWPTTGTVKNVLLYRYQSPLEIFSTAANTQDFPEEWIRPLEWTLAAELGPSLGVPIARQNVLDARAASFYEDVLDWDQDNASIFIQPRRWGVGGLGR